MDTLNRSIVPSEILAGAPVRLKDINHPLGLWLLLLGSVLTLAYNVICDFAVHCPAGLNAPPCAPSRPWFSNEVVVQVMGAAIAALFVMKQMVFSASPLLGYKSTRQGAGESIHIDGNNNHYWKVVVTSAGAGPAKIIDAYYMVSPKGHDSPSANFSYEKAREILIGSGLVEYADFLLWKLSSGATMAPQSETTIFECDDILRKEEGFSVDIIVVYSGRFNDIWAKKIVCIPERKSPMAY